MAETTRLQHCIGGQWLAGEGPPLQSTSPSDDSLVGAGNGASSAQVNAATAAAREAFAKWWDTPLASRIDQVRRYGQAVDQRRDELATLISHETGKPLWESRTEVAAVVGKVDLSINALQERRSEQSFAAGDALAVTRYRPFGVLAVLGPFNFPAHLANGHIVPALLAGNTVVFKPSEQAPAVGQWMVERWMDAGLPGGVVNLVHGARETGEALANDEQLDGLLFTGSSAAGRALHRLFGQWPQKMLALEMGGNNPLVVHRVADRRAAAYETILSAFLTAGQRCTCARRLIITEESEPDGFLHELQEMLAGVRGGLWTDRPEPFHGTVINARQAEVLLAGQQALIDAGGRSLVEMKRDASRPALLFPGVIDVTEIDSRSDEELFGPILQVIRVDGFDAAMREANNTRYGLSAGLLSDDADCFAEFTHRIRAGVVNRNRQTTGASGNLAFGGCGLSGNNRPSGYFAIDYCNWPVASLELDSLRLPAEPLPGIELS